MDNVSHLSVALLKVNCKGGLADFLGGYLGYKTLGVFYEASDLQIPPYLARDISAWWLLSHYPGQLPFQIHLVETEEFTFHYCQTVVHYFYHRHPGYFLFILTKDYSYLFFTVVDWSLERKPWSGYPDWLFLPKPYDRFLLLDRNRPTRNDVAVLSWLQLDSSENNEPSSIYDKVLLALKLSQPSEGLPEWFVPEYYRVDDSSHARQVAAEAIDYLGEAYEALLNCLAGESLYAAGKAGDCLASLMQNETFVRTLAEESRGRLEYALSQIEEAQTLFEEDDREGGLLCIQEATFSIEDVRTRLQEQGKTSW